MLLRSIAFTASFYTLTAAFVIVGSPLLVAPRRYAMVGLRVHARCCLWLLRTIVGLHVEVRGRQHVPKGAALVASKHQSTWETFALIPLFADPALVMKAELGWIPFYGWFSIKFGHILVARQRGPSALRAMLAQARTCLAHGRQIVIFPEGTRQGISAPPDYKTGVVALYEGLGVPCVPVALNSGLYWPRRSRRLSKGTVIVEFLAAIPPNLDRATFRQTLESTIEVATARLVVEGRAAMNASPVAAHAQRCHPRACPEDPWSNGHQSGSSGRNPGSEG